MLDHYNYEADLEAAVTVVGWHVPHCECCLTPSRGSLLATSELKNPTKLWPLQPMMTLLHTAASTSPASVHTCPLVPSADTWVGLGRLGKNLRVCVHVRDGHKCIPWHVWVDRYVLLNLHSMWLSIRFNWFNCGTLSPVPRLIYVVCMEKLSDWHVCKCL